MATISELDVDRGTTYAITVLYKENGVAADITGSTVFFTVKTAEYDTDITDSDAVFKKTVTSHTNPTAGITTINISPSDTATVPPKKYYYDVKIKKATGEIYKLNEGRLGLDGSPTNRQA